MPKVALCLPAFGRQDLTAQFVRETEKAGYPHRLWVLSDHSVERCGVPRARNILTSVALGDPECEYIGNFSNDMFGFPQDWLKIMVQFLDLHESAWAVNVQKIVKYEDKPWGNLLNNEFLPKDDPHWRDYEIAWIAGGGALIRREVFTHLGMWDEGYELGGHEEFDLGMRIYCSGHRVVTLGNLQVFHDLAKGNQLDYPSLYKSNYHAHKWGSMSGIDVTDPKSFETLRGSKPGFKGKWLD